jgi:hypothetical protein
MSGKLELMESPDYENLHSLGYNRLKIMEHFISKDVTIANLMASANYGAGNTPGDDGSNITIAQGLANIMVAVATFLVAIRDGTAATKWDIADSGYGGFRIFAEEAVKGYLRQKGTATPSDGWLLETASGALTAGTAERYSRESDTETGSEDIYRGWGWYAGISIPKIPNVSPVTVAGSAEHRMFRFYCARRAVEIVTGFALAIIQSEIFKIQVGRKIGLIPPEFDVISDAGVNEEFLYTLEGRFPTTALAANNGLCPDALANFVDWDWSYLPQTGLIAILRKRMKSWRVPVASLTWARTMFGGGYSEYDYPTNFAVLMNIGDEQDTDAKKVGYGLLWAIWWLDQFYGGEGGLDIPTLFESVLDNEHWTYKGFKAMHQDMFTNFSLGTLKGQIEPSYFVPASAHFRMEDNTIARGHFSNPRLFQETSPIITLALTAPDSVTALFARGGWNLDQIGAYLRYELLFNVGESSIKLDRQALCFGEHYFTRRQQVINYVGVNDSYDNIRIGADLIYTGALLDQIGLTFEDETQDWSGLIQVITSRLPFSKFPMPTKIESVYNLDRSIALAEVTMAPFISGSAGSPGSDNTNENENGSEEGEE